mmetsp:Transcript_20369/g.43454  ORF Transcript_20369/g.43454 Transcript_20369/m.43454 type:complete len:238 (+) Transcript_20369:75-788(+)
MALEEDKSIILARVAERAERYDEMADFMKDRVMTGTPLNAEERDMFSAAFKNALTERRHAVRVAVGVAQQEMAEGHPDKAALAQGYKSKVEAELSDICVKALNLLQNPLVPTASPGEAKTFYLKMKGDYYRYLAEFLQGEPRQLKAEEARLAYDEGMTEAASLPTTHPVRLGLALNFSVFQHEVLANTRDAIITAEGALKTAAGDLASVSEETRNDAILTMQLLQDNLLLWQPEMQQ